MSFPWLQCRSGSGRGFHFRTARTHGQRSANRERHIWRWISVAQNASVTAKQENLTFFFFLFSSPKLNLHTFFRLWFMSNIVITVYLVHTVATLTASLPTSVTEIFFLKKQLHRWSFPCTYSPHYALSCWDHAFWWHGMF